MTLQSILALLAVAGAALWACRSLWSAAKGGGCASGGCGGCEKGGCPVPRLEALHRARTGRGGSPTSAA